MGAVSKEVDGRERLYHELCRALTEVDKEKVLQVVGQGISLESFDEHGYTGLHEMFLDRREEPALLLCVLGRNINAVDQCEEMTPFHYALKNPSTVSLFLK